jgi:hypothetical protein
MEQSSRSSVFVKKYTAQSEKLASYQDREGQFRGAVNVFPKGRKNITRKIEITAQLRVPGFFD